MNKIVILILLTFSSCDLFPQPQPSPLPSLRPIEAHVQIVSEMLQVVLMEDARRAQIESFTGSLEQGASYEGLYNGLTHSSDYRRLEFAHLGNHVAALDFFATELEAIENRLSPPSELKAKSALPLAEVVDPAQAALAPADDAILARTKASYLTAFHGASVFTLKRVLSDEMLKLLDQVKPDREKLAELYAGWVVQMSKQGVKFGMPLRNRADSSFHFNWAKTATEDQLKWEVLNRIHRTLNQKNKE